MDNVKSPISKTRRMLRRYRTSSRPSFMMMPRDCASVFAEDILFVASLLDHVELSHVALKGILLGCLHLGGLLPWEVDADLFLVDAWGRDLDRELRTPLRECGYELRFHSKRHYHWIRPRRCGVPVVSGTVEVGRLTPTVSAGSGEVVYDRHQPDRRMSERELLPLKKYAFYDTYLWGPSYPDRLLQRTYRDAASSQALRGFVAPPIDAETRIFWSQARPIEGALDWTMITERFRGPGRHRSLSRRYKQAPWWVANHVYRLFADRIRRSAGGNTR